MADGMAHGSRKQGQRRLSPGRIVLGVRVEPMGPGQSKLKAAFEKEAELNSMLRTKASGNLVPP